MASKRIELVFDLDAKDVQLATDRTLTLTQQIRILKQELAKGQLGQKEFEIVAAKVGDLEDSIGKASRRSADFATTLQLIPGPIGEIASKVNGAIALLKQFSGFSLKDLRFQFQETAKDFKEILANIGSIGQPAKEIAEANSDVAQSTDDVTESLDQNETASVGALAQIQNLTQAQKENSNVNTQAIASQKQYIQNLEARRTATFGNIDAGLKLSDLTKKQQQELASLNNQILLGKKDLQGLQDATKSSTQATQTNTVVQNENAGAQTKAGIGARVNAAANTALAAAETAAAQAGLILRGVLISLGIGAVIVLAGQLLSVLIDWFDSTTKLQEATKKLNDELSRTNQILDLEEATIKRANALRLSELKASGANEATTRRELLKQKEEDLKRALANEAEAVRLYNEGLKKGDSETLKALGDNELKRTEQRRDAENQLRILRNETIVAERKELTDANNKKKEQAKKNADDELNRKKAELDALIQLEIDKGNTDKKTLEKLLEDRLKLELTGQKKSDAEKELARKENTKKVKAALDEDLQLRIRSISATIDEEQNSAVVSVERLKALLTEKKNLELQNTQLTVEERKALVTKYEKDIRDIEAKQREDKLVKDIAATRGNFDEQIRLLTEFQEEVVNSEKYNGEEQLRVINDTNEKILQLQEERFKAQLTATELEYGLLFASDENYYSKTRALYDAEEQRYRDLLKNKKITQAEFDAFFKQSTDARISLDRQELDAKMANFQAVSQLFAASAALVGEQTKAGKAFAIAGATIDTYVAANQVISDKTIPTFLKVITAAGIIIKGLTNVKRISEVQLPTVGGGTEDSGSQTTKPMGTINVNAQRRAQGGMVNGPGTETSDSIPAMLSNGEFVVNARSTRLFQPLLAAINGYGVNTPAFAAGGLVSQQAEAPRMDNTERIAEAIQVGMANQPIRTYVTAGDITNQQQFDRVIKSRSLI
jgi:hypothetical protein